MAKGDGRLDEHRHAAFVEDARFLIADGAPLREIARRLGCTYAAYAQRMYRCGLCPRCGRAGHRTEPCR